MIESKRCSKCGEVKPISEFHIRDRNKGSYVSRCKDCKKHYRKQYYEDNREKENKNSKRYNKEHSEEISTQKKQWYQEHKEDIRAYNKNYYKNNRDNELKRSKERRKNYPEYLAKYQREYRQTLKGKLAHGNFEHYRRIKKNTTPKKHHITEIQWQKILENQDNKCIMCGVGFTDENIPTIDHIMPLSKGGEHTSANIQALCKSCNSSKKDKLDLNLIQSWIIGIQIED